MARSSRATRAGGARGADATRARAGAGRDRRAARDGARARRAGATTRATATASDVGRGKAAIVVGGGVGGLGMASRLANAGFEVTLLEKNGDVGGRCRSETFAGGGGRVQV